MAWPMRRLPSSEKGSVTTATVSTLPVSPPSWLAIEATTGAAPVPVPPPRPAVMKTMSEPSRASQIFSVSSTAAWRPTSGLAPAPEALGQLAADLDLDRRAVRPQRLQVGVHRDELDPLQARGDHAADRVASAPTHAHHLDAGAVDLLLGELDAARTVVLFAHAPQIPSEQPVMKPQWRQMRLQW